MDGKADEKIMRLAQILKAGENIVFFGGAGVSTASNIPDFRSAHGIFSKKLGTQLTPEQLVSHTMFVRYTEEFYDFYKKHLLYPEAKPNACHTALAELEQMGKLKAIVTQNIDGLHQAAGSKRVYELHGSVFRNYCTECGKAFEMEYVYHSEGIPHCSECGGLIKPDVVLYEEGLDQQVISGAVNAIANADTLIIGGTSLVVYPAAGLINYFRGDNLVLINKTVTSADKDADLVINDDIASVMKQAVERMKE
ncbi:MAG: NAD-dependent protein deacylase [Lachnospiraceae bacterium]|nr:NAD-dependent protein deacylase [Lachnospiraceae bacterium]